MTILSERRMEACYTLYVKKVPLARAFFLTQPSSEQGFLLKK